MTNEPKNRPLSPINNLLNSDASFKHHTYQQILTQMVSSPKLQKILKKVHTSIRDLQFITFQQFIQQNQLRQLSDDYFDKNDHFERYETELQRRKRQLQILLEMEHIHFEKHHKNTSARKNSHCKISPSKHQKNQNFQNNNEVNERERKVKFTSQSHKYEFNHENLKKSSLSHRKMSVVSSSRYSRQLSSSRLQSHKRIKQVEIFQSYTQGRPYIEQYYNQLRSRGNITYDQRLKTMPSTSREKNKRKCSRVGKIKKQVIQNESAENQYQNSFTQKKNRTSNQAQKAKTKQFQDNEYDMIPLKNERIKDRLSRKMSNNHQKQACKQLITQVKKYQEINHNYIKKLKSIDRNDRVSRDKLLEVSSRDKFEKKKNIEKLKNRISSKSSRKQVRF